MEQESQNYMHVEGTPMPLVEVTISEPTATEQVTVKPVRKGGRPKGKGMGGQMYKRQVFAVSNVVAPRDVVFETAMQDLALFTHTLATTFSKGELLLLPVDKRFDMMLDLFGAMDTARNRAIKNNMGDKMPAIFQNFQMPQQTMPEPDKKSTVPTQSVQDLEAAVMGMAD